MFGPIVSLLILLSLTQSVASLCVQGSIQLCRPSVGPCDSPEYCDGVSDVCPPDSFVKAGIQCRGGFKFPCAQPTFCNGVSATCPLVLLNTSELCRPAQGPCDLPEYCSGLSLRCPPNVFESGISCGDGQVCSGFSANCPAAAPSNITSPPTPSSPPGCGNGVINTGEQCDPPGPCCTYACLFASNKTVCRPNSGKCDKVEFCSGTSSTCPTDEVKSAGVVCRASNPAKFPCDLSEVCDGSSKTCPADEVKSKGQVCRPVRSFAPCDLPEYCDGVDKTCPPDQIASKGVECRLPNNSTYPCFEGAECDGKMKFCPVEVQVQCP